MQWKNALAQIALSQAFEGQLVRINFPPQFTPSVPFAVSLEYELIKVTVGPLMEDDTDLFAYFWCRTFVIRIVPKFDLEKLARLLENIVATFDATVTIVPQTGAGQFCVANFIKEKIIPTADIRTALFAATPVGMNGAESAKLSRILTCWEGRIIEFFWDHRLDSGQVRELLDSCRAVGARIHYHDTSILATP